MFVTENSFLALIVVGGESSCYAGVHSIGEGVFKFRFS